MHTNFMICPMLYAIAMGQMINLRSERKMMFTNQNPFDIDASDNVLNRPHFMLCVDGHVNKHYTLQTINDVIPALHRQSVTETMMC